MVGRSPIDERVVVRRRLGIVVTVVMTSALGACSSDDEPQGGGDPAPSSTSTPTESEPTTAPPSAEASADAATGPLLEMPEVSMRAPETFEMYESTAFSKTAAPKRGIGFIAVGAEPVIGDPGSLQEQAALTARNITSEFGPPEILDPVTIGDVEMFHLSGPYEFDTRLDQYGVAVGSSTIYIRFALDQKMAAGERQALIDSCLATLELA